MLQPIRRLYPFIVCLALLLCGCMDQPARLDQHMHKYETLAQLVVSEVQPDQSVDYAEAKGKLRQLMSDLDVHRVRHVRNGAFVMLSGQSNVITGQFSYLYKLGDGEIDLSAYAYDGITREHLQGPWYIEKAYFD